MKDLVSLLRLLAFVEGISLLALLFIAMPLKYFYEMPEAVSVVGMTHGSLFLVFVAFAMLVSQRKAWSEGFLAQLVISSMIPFGMVVMDRKLKRVESFSVSK